MKILTVLSGVLGLYFCFMGIYNSRFTYDNVFTLFEQIFRWNSFLRYVMGMFIASLVLLVTLKPNDPLPWNWVILLTFSIFLIFICNIWIGLWGLIAGGIGLLDYL